MEKVGIITEYNPFHKGHIYHLKQAKKQGDILIAIVSGLFCQRGLPSLISRYDKTLLALKNGVDLVVELPMCYAVQSADYFAKYAIQSLSCLNIDTLCFGSETNDIDYLNTYIDKLNKIKKDVQLSFNQNISRSLEPLKANDILGIQYIKECKKHDIRPITIQRNEQFISATKTREDYFSGLPQYNDIFFLKEQNWNSYYPYLKAFLQLTNPAILSTFFMVNEGIEYRLIENAKKYDTWNDFLKASISKTYSKARIQRTCLFILMQITKEEMQANDSFCGVKVLGFNSKGQEVLKENKGNNIYTKFNELPDFLKTIELKSVALYNSALKKPILESKVIVYDH